MGLPYTAPLTPVSGEVCILSVKERPLPGVLVHRTQRLIAFIVPLFSDSIGNKNGHTTALCFNLAKSFLYTACCI